MKVEYINPFLEAFESVVQQLMNIPVEKGQLFVKEGTQSGHEVITSIGVGGDINGNIILSMSEEDAKLIASKMMLGMEVKELDDMAKSAISELGNMIAGNSTANYSKMGINITITPPSLFCGKDMTIFTYKAKTICVPIKIASSIVEIDLALS